MNKIKLIIFLIVTTLVCVPSYSQTRKVKPKKNKTTAVAGEIMPDAYPHKAKPDSHPKSLQKPNVAGLPAMGDGTQGFDISHYQGRIDWNQLSKDPNCGFVYLKATEGPTFRDDTYNYNFNECKRTGVKVGSYIFFRQNCTPQDQFNNFVTFVDTRKQDLIPMVDVEYSPSGITIAAFQDKILSLCQLLEKEYGVKPLIYTGRHFYNKYFHGYPAFRGYKFWIANYTTIQPVLNGNDDYLIWQYTGHGRARGVRGEIDQNKFVGRHSLREIMYFGR